MSSLSLELLQRIYPLEEPHRTRTVPMQVLCLGFSRSGTDSLRRALYTLGYTKVYHGAVAGGPQPADCLSWIKLFAQRARSLSLSSTSPSSSASPSSPTSSSPTSSTDTSSSSSTAAQLDAILGDCDCLTDLPTALFAPELLSAYPDAHVILNRRRDVAAWAASWEATIEATALGWSTFVLSLFDAEMFWVVSSFRWAIGEVRYGPGGQGVGTGRRKMQVQEAYHAHFEATERVLGEQGREWLDWTVQDGWGPLCAWLGKEVPEGEAFPMGNAMEEWRVRQAEVVFKPKVMRAVRNLAGLCVGVVALLVAVWMARK